MVDDLKDDATKMNEIIVELGNSEYRVVFGFFVFVFCDRLKVVVVNEDVFL